MNDLLKATLLAGWSCTAVRYEVKSFSFSMGSLTSKGFDNAQPIGPLISPFQCMGRISSTMAPEAAAKSSTANQEGEVQMNAAQRFWNACGGRSEKQNDNQARP